MSVFRRPSSIRLSVLACAVFVSLAACGPELEEPGSSPETAQPPSPASEYLEPLEPVASESPDDGAVEAMASNYCCQISWLGDPQPFMCVGYNTLKAWARTKCYATAASIPATVPVLASGTCSSYVFCRGLP
ncbi:hypothetical protein [Pyxidicoccus xibeiensis]|uniref:hypothetical protein n=1 Tax=Pyxidicoccus xibeiensis TaxID=2906759 RepID=UPI0020A7AB44|nr:hypothetical protein [Pyxidicoccus xibeiensis]MCP3143830.1 hypothetical protein [Pyxidicoccus xibeiensis]